MKSSAHTAYLVNHAMVTAKLKKLQAALETHAMKEANNPTAWGFSGDLAHLEDLLDQSLVAVGVK